MNEEKEDKICGDKGRDERWGGEAITCTGETERQRGFIRQESSS